MASSPTNSVIRGRSLLYSSSRTLYKIRPRSHLTSKYFHVGQLAQYKPNGKPFDRSPAVGTPQYGISRRHYGNGLGGIPIPGQNSGDSQEDPSEADQEPEPDKKTSQSSSIGSQRLARILESAATTILSITVLGLIGYGYHRGYKYLVLQKMKRAFQPGDPMLELAGRADDKTPTTVLVDNEELWIRRIEQEKIDRIVNGTDQGHYHLLIGEKGTGKSSMLLDAMQKVEGEGISMFEAHADLEIFRIRLGKALDYEFHEDYIGSLFSIKGPRDTTPLLDIERAFNKLEKIALKRRKTVRRPLVLIINSTHLLRDDEDGQDLLELVQQRAEQWAASNLVTVVLNSDDYWVYERLKQYATRLEVLPVLDLPKEQAVAALASYREKYKNEKPSLEVLESLYDRIGGRLSFLNRVARSPDMSHAADKICYDEKTWFLNKCGILGEEMDDDVMDQQKYASAAMVLAKALVEQEREAIESHPEDRYLLPQIPLHKARYIMTRADFIKGYDHINVFTIDAQAMVRADSVPMMNAFREVCSEEGFDDFLQATLDRISAIESLGRTRELVAKDLVLGNTYKIKGRPDRDDGMTVQMQTPE